MEVEAEISRWLKTEVKKARAGTEAREKHWICNPRPEGLSQSFSFSLCGRIWLVMGLRSEFLAFPGCLGTAVSTAEKIGDGLVACRKSSSYAHPHLLQSGASPCAVRHLPVIFSGHSAAYRLGSTGCQWLTGLILNFHSRLKGGCFTPPLPAGPTAPAPRT